MSRHSQNATAKAFFTYAEKQKLSYGTRKKIIGGHSLKGFEMCSLCLQPVINPMSCQKGHLFCKKCILEYFLSQKKEKQKQIEEWKKQQKQIELEKKSSILSALDSEIYSFHKTECSALPKRKSNNFQDSNQKNPQIIVPLHKIPQTKENILQNDPVYLQSIEKKKKFDEIRKQDNQLKDKSKNDIKSFWVPSKTPKANDSIVKKPSENILCPEGGEPIRYKRLIEVNFTLVPKIEEI
ncbi:enos interacting protein [Anaeramoeba ignava]|uniref:Enos interacting protein n=1 Tax=Anaeramoeba ignava TaxID=1746090 RepID=A0A9Q0R6J1_ANAIG|nr:enos interacting protein [Anaeramoeba ignava]